MPFAPQRPLQASRLVPEAREGCGSPLLGPTVLARLLPSGGFGPRTLVLLLLGLVWIGPAWFEPRFLWAMGGWDVCVLLLWAWDYARLPSPAMLSIRRVWHEPVALGTPSKVSLEIRNLSPTALRFALIDDLPASLSSAPPERNVSVAAGGTATAGYEVFARERGDVGAGRLFFRYQSALRVAERWAAADVGQTIRAYPNLEEARRQTLRLIRSRQVALERRLRRHRGQGRDFESLREYRPGDPWRDICWTATARRNRLITREYQAERSQTVWIVLDAGRLLRARIQGPSKLDYAVNAALSLAQAALHSGDRVGLLAYGRRIQQQLPPGRGAGHLRAILERLALVCGEASEADHLRAAETLLARQSPRSLIVWLTDISETLETPEVIESAMHMASRHLVLFAVIQQPELLDAAARAPANAATMYRHIAAQETLDRRQVLLERLHRRGVLAVEFEAASISPALVNQYLDIKERSLL